MAKQNFKKEDEKLENVNEAMSSAGQWVINHQNLLYGIVLVIILVVGGFYVARKYWLEPKAEEAGNGIALATDYFMQEDWEKALNGDGAECDGFLAIAEDYSMQQGKLASLYAGICYYKLGQYEDAAEYLKKFSASDIMIDPASHQMLGDAYANMGDYENALNAFDAAAKSGNDIVAPMSLKKAGLVNMELGNKEAAKKCFEQIRDNYPESTEAQDIEKYIAQVQ